MNYKNYFEGKTALVTGGTGSFGHALTNKLLPYNLQKIIIFSRDEKKQEDMRNHYSSPIMRFVIGDVRDKQSINQAVKNVDYVFHAAAFKQVPVCEFFPMEAVKTNVIGAANVINASIEHNVKRVVILSTDKAVYPINVMGTTKALMEKVMIASSRNTNTILCGVRYGNVMYTRGSILPYFVSLIQKKEPLRVTNPKMTRFLLSLDEAVNLVLYAFVKGKSGYMYVHKAPACTIETLTKALCEIFKYKKGYIKVGTRAGEKTHETLVSSEELLRAKDLGLYFAIAPETQGLDYNKYLPSNKKDGTDFPPPFTSENTTRLNIRYTKELLLKIPEIRNSMTPK